MNLELDGEVILITGGTDGLGAATAEGLVAEGAKVAVCGRDEARVHATEDRLAAAGGDVLGVVADVTIPADLARFVGAALTKWGRIYGLVNNAGQSAAGPFESISDETWAYDLELKVMAAIRLSRLVLPHMRASGAGAIVNVLITGARAVSAGSLPTTASRAAGLAITKALSKEFAPENIRANAILIAAFRSGQGVRRAAATGQDLEAMYAQEGKMIPMGRVGREEEFADLATFLLSKRASYLTGSAINLDGGVSPVP